MKKLRLLVLVLSISSLGYAQVGIGTSSPDASAALDVSATDKGFLMPRMTSAQREAIVNPATSLTVFDTDTNTFWSYVFGTWIEANPGVGKFIDGATPDIAYYQDRVGIGRNAFATVHKLYVESIKDTDGSHAAVKIDAIYEGTGTATTTYGLAAIARTKGGVTIDYAVGTQGIAENPNSGATMNYGVGSWPYVTNSGNIGWGAGLATELINSGSVTTGYGLNVSVKNNSGATMGQASLGSLYMNNEGSITGDAYGLWIGGVGSGSVDGDAYALYISTPFPNVTGNSFALYSENTADSYIEGNLGVGISSPLQKVHISGVLRLEPQSSAPTGALGDLYVDTDTNLYFHDGTSWKAVQVGP